MPTVSTDNAPAKVDGKEESAHLLEAAVNGERYGSNKAVCKKNVMIDLY